MVSEWSSHRFAKPLISMATHPSHATQAALHSPSSVVSSFLCLPSLPLAVRHAPLPTGVGGAAHTSIDCEGAANSTAVTISGGDGAFVLTMGEPGEFSTCKPALDDAVADFKETYDKVSEVKTSTLADGYLFTAQNEPEIGGTNYWLLCRRTLKGQAWAIESTCATPAQLANAAAFARSVHA